MNGHVRRRELLIAAAAGAVAAATGCGRDKPDLNWRRVAAIASVPRGVWTGLSTRVPGEPKPVDVHVRVDTGVKPAKAEGLLSACGQGCAVRYVEGSRKFICPCDGAIFDSDGTFEAGPRRPPLERIRARVQGDEIQVYLKPRRS